MYKIVHVHTDHKFYHAINRYRNDSFINHLVVMGVKTSVNVELQQDATFFDPIQQNLEKIVDYLSDFDMIVFANLTPFNRKILVHLPKKIKVVWWFFGHEFHAPRLHRILSRRTIQAVGNDYNIKPTKTVKDYYRLLKFNYQQIKRAYTYSRNVDSILMYSKEEYNFVKKKWVFMPKLITTPIGSPGENPFIFHLKKDFIIHGHNRNMSNNHLDILDIIKKAKNKIPFTVKMFLSYGIEKNYYNELQRSITELPNVEPVTNFLSKEEFNQTYKDASAFVLNSYRQIGLANIFTAILNNCKIYLNDKNVVKTWLVNEGLFIYSIDEFKRDYENNNLKLTEQEAKNNNFKFNEIIDRNTSTDFHNNLLKILKS